MAEAIGAWLSVLFLDIKSVYDDYKQQKQKK